MPERTIADEMEDEGSARVEDAGDRAPTDRTPWWARVLKAPARTDDLAGYLSHPLNPSGTPAGARIARGLSAMFGGLELAVVDLMLGVLQLIAERRRQQA
ncbi:MAG: hypothetical protein IRY83_14935 [Chloroflexi bacterium]|nr:hypothetical protein [Chloroflexota bacterium]